MNEPVNHVDGNGESMNTDSKAVESEVDTSSKVSVEEFKVSGDDLSSKLKDLIHQGNIRRIMIKNETGQTLMEVPLTAAVAGGVLGTLLFPAVPVLAALGAVGALVARLTLVIERQES